jgi:plasmid rolling circle replication initiator protein Rep
MQLSLDTLAQLDSDQTKPSIEDDFLISSQDKTDTSVLYKRARAKYLTNAIVYRLADIESPLNKSYWNTYHCASALVKTGDKVTGKYCKNRWCMVCNRIRTAKLINTYMPVVSEWSDKQFMTLTIPNVSAKELPLTIKSMTLAFVQIKKILTNYHQRYDIQKPIGLRKLECTYNPKRNDYHPHFHLIVDSYFTAVQIQEQWLKKFPDANIQAQDIRPADDKSCIELFKYFTKVMTKHETSTGEKKQTIMPYVLDTIFRAIKGVRTFQPFGFRIECSESGESSECEEDNPKISRILDEIVYEWMQEFSDWIDQNTGETLSGYEPTEKMRNVTGDL